MEKKRKWFFYKGRNRNLKLNLRKIKLTLVFTMLISLSFGERLIEFEIPLQSKNDKIQEMGILSSVSVQQKLITGVVVDKDGLPLPGVSAIVAGTIIGTVTDSDGKFSLSVPSSAEALQFSFVGMKTKELSITGITELSVVMEEESIGIEEVVAIGYGSVYKRDLTGSVASVQSEKLGSIPVTSAAQAMTGQIAGVQITKTEGSPDADIKIRVRGGGSITQDNSPLLLVDGFPVDNINDIAPTDIQTIDVMKDASSTAIYGARGANGVILITTKKGAEGKGKVSYNSYYGIKNLTKQLPMMDPYNFVLYQLEVLQESQLVYSYFGDIRDFDLYKEMRGTNWQEETLKDGFSLYNNLSFTGGTENTKYNISITRNDEDEVLESSGYNRTNLMINLTHKINNWLSLDVSSFLSDALIKGARVSEKGQNGAINQIMGYRPVNGIKDHIDMMLVDPELYEAYDSRMANPVNFLHNAYARNSTLTIRNNGAANISLSKSFKYRFEFGRTYSDYEAKHFYGMTYGTSRLDGAPSARRTLISNKNYKLSNVITYTKGNNFLTNHNLVVMAGQEVNKATAESKILNVRFFPKDIDPESAIKMFQLADPNSITTNEDPSTILSSYFGRINYNYKKKYYASATMRADGSSKFAPGNQWGYFPSFGVSWNISEENFLNKIQWLDLLKFRASYGESGNNRIINNAWQKVFSVQTSKLGFGNEANYTPFIAPGATLSNSKLKWETTTSQNLGLDFLVFNQRLSGTIEVYENKTKDLLINMTIPASTGYSRQWQNTGQTSNRGVEFTLNNTIIDKKDFTLSTSFNISFNKNRIDHLGDAEDWEASSNFSGDVYGGISDYLVESGGEIGQMYGYETEGMYSFDDFNYDPEKQIYTVKEGVSDNSGVLSYRAGFFGPGALKLKDQNGDFIVDETDKVVLGNANPKHTGGFNIQSQYKGFDLQTFFNWVYGNSIYNAQKLFGASNMRSISFRNLMSFMENSFKRMDPQTGKMVNDPTQLTELNKDADMWNPNFIYGPLHSWAIEDGSFLRLNSVTLGYTLPRKMTRRVGIDKLRIYATGYNLWIWTKYSGWDPEVDVARDTPLTPGVDYSSYPRSRSFNFGINVEL